MLLKSGCGCDWQGAWIGANDEAGDVGQWVSAAVCAHVRMRADW